MYSEAISQMILKATGERVSSLTTGETAERLLANGLPSRPKWFISSAPPKTRGVAASLLGF